MPPIPARKPLTQFQQHQARYGKGCGAKWCDDALNIVLCRGQLPCDILFIGEAPGESEDVLGRPFVGPAGKLLDTIVAGTIFHEHLRLAFTNIVGCIPRDDKNNKTAEPCVAHIQSCSKRLQDLVRIANPKLIVRVGKLAEQWTTPVRKTGFFIPMPKVPMVTILHPAYILRNQNQISFLVKQCRATLNQAYIEHLHAPSAPQAHP